MINFNFTYGGLALYNLGIGAIAFAIGFIVAKKKYGSTIAPRSNSSEQSSSSQSEDLICVKEEFQK